MAGEYDHLLSDPAVQAAISMQREAERLWVVDPEKHPDPQLWAAVLTVIAFAQGGRGLRAHPQPDERASARRTARADGPHGGGGLAMAKVTGGDKIEAALKEIAARIGDGTAVRIGFLEGSTYPDGTSTPMVAAILEFGAPGSQDPAAPVL